MTHSLAFFTLRRIRALGKSLDAHNADGPAIMLVRCQADGMLEGPVRKLSRTCKVAAAAKTSPLAGKGHKLRIVALGGSKAGAGTAGASGAEASPESRKVSRGRPFSRRPALVSEI